MKNMKKLGAALCLALTTSVLPIFAQSNTNNSTAGTIRTDVDKYIDLNYFNEVKFEKAFLQSNLSTDIFQLGGATKVNDIYLAAFYQGMFWNGLEGSNHTNSDNTDVDNKKDTTLNSSVDIDSKYITSTAEKNHHDFKTLLGLKNMAFTFQTGLNFDTDIKKLDRNKVSSDKNEDYPSEEPAYKPYKNYDYKEINNKYNFNIGWGGMSFNSDKTIIKPYALIGVSINDNSLSNNYLKVNKTYDNVSDQFILNQEVDYKKTQSYTTDYNGNKSYSSTELYFTLGSEFVWGKDTAFKQTFEASNDFYYNINPKQISLESTNTKDNVNPSLNKSTTTEVTNAGKLDMTDSIYTAYRFEYKPTDKMTLGLFAGANTSMTFENPGFNTTRTTTVQEISGKNQTIVEESYDNGSSNKVTIDGELQDRTSVTNVDVTDFTMSTNINPSFGLGFSYAVSPKFVINIGYFGDLPNINFYNRSIKKITTTNKFDPATKEIIEVVKNENNSRDFFLGVEEYKRTISTGFVWLISNYCNLDVNVDIKPSFDYLPSFNDLWTADWDLGFSFKM